LTFVGGNFWDGRATGERLGNPAADQALGPFLNPVEQNMPTIQAVCEDVARSKYADLFEEVWGLGSLDCSMEGAEATYDRIGLSIAAYEASPEVSPFSSKFDVYWEDCLGAGNGMGECGRAEGDKAELDPNNILTDLEWDGLIEFGEYCSPCHISHELGPNGEPPLFTDFTYDNIGVPRNPENPFYRMDRILIDGIPINPEGEGFVDYGLGDFLRTRPEWAGMADENDGKMKVPTLRNVDFSQGGGQSKSYMHNGVFQTLEEVVHFYNTRDVPEENWPPPEVPQNVNREILEGVPLGNLELDAEAEAATVAFLRTLSDGYVEPDDAPSVTSLNPRAVDSKGGILFAMPSAGPVEVKIYNIAGQQVRRLGIQYLQEGINRIQWNGRDNTGRLARSGIYFYQIRTHKQTETAKAILIR
jgi:cytochrome c peroxidase